MNQRLDSIERHKHNGMLPLMEGNKDIPNPPTFVNWDREIISGEPGVRTTWLEPTQNTDGTELRDFYRYEVQQQVGLTVSWDAPTMVAPAKGDESLNRLMDRAGMGEGWTGGDGGASHRDTAGRDWWFWSDSNWGELRADGSTKTWFMLRNSLTRTVGSDRDSMVMKTGRANLLPSVLTSADWVMPAGHGTLEDVPGGVRFTAAGGTDRYITAPWVAASAGESVTLSARVDGPISRFALQWRGSAGYTTRDAEITGDPIISISDVAPEGTEFVRMICYANDGDQIDVTQVYAARGDSRMASWRSDIKEYQFTNLMHDPEGRGKSVDTTVTEVFRNIARNPSAETDVNESNLYNGATVERVASASAWTGRRVLRVNKNTAGNGNVIMFDYAGRAGAVAPGDEVRYRLRVRRGSLTNPDCYLHGRFLFYDSGSRVMPDGGSVDVILTDEWAEYTFSGVVPATANTAALMFTAAGPSWSAADWFEVDGREMYVAPRLPDDYFDGSTPSGDGLVYEWAGVPNDSDSIMSVSSRQRRNVAIDSDTPDLADWAPTSTAFTVSLDASDHPTGGTGVPMPQIVNSAALDPVRTKIASSPGSVTGIGINSDSTGETTGNQSNPDLSDRYVETLQRELRRVQKSPGVLVDPVGYYGATSYVAARFQHPGPVDWVTRGPFVEFTSMGVGGRGFALPYGSSAYLRATFSRATLELPTHSWGRTAVVFVDGEEKARLDTYSVSDGLIQWDTGELGHGEHMISVESSRAPNLNGGEVRVAGAMLFDDASDTAGVRVYDMSCSGRALEDHVNNPTLLEHGLERPMDLMVWSLDFNDAGRNITPAQHKANYKTVIARHRSLGFSGPILIMAKWDPSATVTDQWTYSMDQYRAVMREVAQEDSTVAFVDLGEVMPGPDVDESLYQDWVHQNEIGNERIAGVLRELLAPTPAPSSVLVETTGIWGGVDFTGYPAGVFAKDGTWTFSVDVKGPVGSRFRVQVDDADGAGGVLQSPIIDFTGDWQRESVTGVITGDAPLFSIRKAASPDPLDFRVALPMIEEGAVTRDYFSASTPDTDLIDYRALPDGTAIASGYTPPLWRPRVTSRLTYVTDVSHGFGGAVFVEPVTGPSPGIYVDPGHTVTGNWFTAVAWVLPGPTTTQARLTVVTSGTNQTFDFTVKPGQWNELRVSFDAAGATINDLHYVSVSDEAFHITEVTLVEQNEYTAPAFSGGSGGSHATSVWSGLPYQSTSTLTMSNTSHTENEYQHTTLITADAVGLEGWKFFWSQGAIGVGDTGLMFLQSFFHRPMGHETGFNFHRYGDIVVARFDLATETLQDVYVLEEKAGAQWGEGLWVDGDWLYVYGGAEHEDEVRVERFPVAEMTTRLASREVWDGTTWSATSTDPAPVANLPLPGGFSAVRVLDGKWVALFTAGFMDHLQSWEATAPEGPFVPADVVWSYPDDGVTRYVPRFHPQFDSGQYGVSMSVCESGADRYRPFFLRGPSGARQAAFGEAFWGDSVFTEDPEHVAVPVGLEEPYAVRVRTADKYGNVSVWAEGSQQGPGASLPEVPKPSTPTALSFFRGGRVYYDGLDEWGERYEGFQHYEVHLSSAQDFDPNNWTRVDASIVEGGWTPISVERYGVYYVVIVVVTDHGTSVASEPATFSPERLSDPDLGDMLIDGARLQPGSVNASSLTVGAFSDNLLLNSGFEVAALEDGTKPSMWAAGWPRGDFGSMPWGDTGHWERVTDDAISGSASLRIDTYETTWRQVLSDPPIPVKPGDIYYVGARFRTDGIDGDVRLNLLVGATEADVNNFGVPEQQTIEVGRTAGGQSVNLVEGPVEIPAEFGDGSGVDMLFAAVAIEARATGRSYSTWVDDVEVKRIVGEAAIADASINRAKIRYLAVDDARIANVGVGKLVAGELFADITISSRIMTAETGKRWEANIDGAYTFNPDKTAGDDQVPITQMTSTDGGLVSRWFRTNTVGTRIEMGTYGMGANSALMSFYPETAPDGSQWQFPPAFGFGGGTRTNVNIPGIAMHAGSQSETFYDRYGMNMIGVDQVGGIGIVTGNLLDGTQASEGADITLNAGGTKGAVRLMGGGYDRSYLRLEPGSGDSEMRINNGKIVFDGVGEEYYIETGGEEWAGLYSGLLLNANNGFRVHTNSNEVGGTNHGLIFSAPGEGTNIQHRLWIQGIYEGNGWDKAAKIRSRGNLDTYITLWWDGTNFGMTAYHGADDTEVGSKIFT